MSDIHAVTYEGGATVTTANSGSDPAGPFAGLLVTGTGTLKLTLLGGYIVTLSAVPPVGSILPLATLLVWTTGTSATVVGLYALPLKAPLNPGVGSVDP